MKITTGDIFSYDAMQTLLEAITAQSPKAVRWRNVPVDYVKSAPYLLSFMENYQLKKQVRDFCVSHPDFSIKQYAAEQYMLLKKAAIHSYRPIAANNARLEHLKDTVFADGKIGSEALLWMPPSRPFYRTGGVFDRNRDFSKVLVFSSWEMVPRISEIEDLGYINTLPNVEVGDYVDIEFRDGYRIAQVLSKTRGSLSDAPANFMGTMKVIWKRSYADCEYIRFKTDLLPLAQAGELYRPEDFSDNSSLRKPRVTKKAVETFERVYGVKLPDALILLLQRYQVALLTILLRLTDDADHQQKTGKSKLFGDEIYRAWGLDPEYNYRAVGRLVSARNKIMLLFDFSKAENWKTNMIRACMI